MSKSFATFAFVNHFNLADELTNGLRKLSRGRQHKKLRNHCQPAVRCYIDNGRARPFYMASSNGVLDDLLTVHRSITLVNFQLDAQNSLFIYIKYIY